MADEKPVRKFPPPCWSKDEAMALIEAYRERWYALRRGYLRTADWDSVADQVGNSCPGVVPAKTSAQCRHKMEKLRQRYRAEKQRFLSYPGPFFSSWFYYEAMDAMEHGGNLEGGVPVNSMLKTLDLKKKDEGSNPSPNFDQTSLNPGRGMRFKPVGDRGLLTLASSGKNSGKNTNVKSAPNFGSRVSNLDYSSQYMDAGYDKEEEDDGGEGDEFEDEFLIETPIDQNLGNRGSRSHKNSLQGYPPRSSNLTPRKFSKVEKVGPKFWEDGSNVNNQVDADGEFWVKVPRDRNCSGAGFRGKYSGQMERKLNTNFDVSGMNGFNKSGGGRGGIRRGSSAVSDMVSSIKLLGDGFMKMEKMKMEMAREIEKMRTETEMKRNELMIESQKQIVEAFVKGLVERKKRKQKPAMVVTES